MKKVKSNKLGRRILSIVLTAALVVGLMPNNVLTVSAEESNSTEPSVTTFATPEQLMSSDNFALHSDYIGVAQKVYFGSNITGNGAVPQTWYIAGSDADNSIVLLCDPALPMATGTKFENSYTEDKTYDNSWNCTYGTPPSVVYPNHYGGSALRLTSLKELESSAFTASEQMMMLETTIYTMDEYADSTYSTTDKLYPAYGDFYYVKYITVGANNGDSLNGGLKVSMTSAPYNSGDVFWLRTPRLRPAALVATPGTYAGSNKVTVENSVVPAFRLNLSSVLFASAAPAATSDAGLTDTMTFRVDGTEKIKSKAAYTTCGVTANYDEGDGNVFLYVQDADSVYSAEITNDTTVALSDMTGINNLTDESTKIWLEKSEDNVAYAVMAEALLTEHIPNADDGDCATAITCSICGTVTTEAKENHIDDNGDGICDNCDYLEAPEHEDGYYQLANAGNLIWLAEQVKNNPENGFKAILLNDIVIPDNKWVPMDVTEASVLDGGGHSITINCSNSATGFSLFARCNQSEVKNLVLKGSIVVNTDGTVGALCTSAYKSTFTNVISYVNITNSGTGAVGGLAGKFGGQDGSEINNCAVYADISGTTAGGLVGLGWDGYQYYSIKNSVYAGNVTGTTAGAIVGNHQTGNTTSVFSNVYWNETDGLGFFGTTNKTHDLSTVSAKTEEAFASGDVAYLLNGTFTDGTWSAGPTDGTQSWYQTLGTDAYPVPDNTHGTVYYVFKCDGTTPVYRNENANEPHVDEALDGVCDACQARFAYKVAASSKLLGKGTSVAEISMNPVNGYVKSGESITVTAQDVLEFVGWYLPSDMNEAYQIKEGRTALSTELTYTFVPSEDVTLVAVYDKHTPTITVGTTSYVKSWGDENFKLDVSHNNSDADAALTYSSSDEDVATVDTNGMVTIKGVGHAIITVSMAESTNYYAAVDKTVTVTVNKATAPTLANANMTYIYAQSKTGENVTIKGIPEDCGKATYRISSVEDDSEMLANVSVADGTVTYNVKALDSYNESDSATIKVAVETERYETATYTLTISRTDKLVQEISAENIALTYGGNGTNISVVGAKTPLTYTVIEDSVENGDVITVDEDGKVSIANAGTAKVRITAVETDIYKTAICEITITVAKAELTVVGAVVQARAYDGTNAVQITGVTLNGVVAGDEVAVNVEKLTGTLSDKVAGEYTSVTLPELTLTGADADNYVLTQPTEAVSTQVAISKAKAVITTKYDSYTRIYNDPAFSIAGDITTVGEATLVYSVSDGVDAEGKPKAASDIIAISQDGLVTVVGSGTVKVSLDMAESANYEAAETKTITIQVLAWDDASRDGFFVKAVSVESYTGKAIKPEPEVWDGNGELCLEKGRDYTISYKNNKNVYTLKEGEEGFNAKKAPTMIIKGKGNYDGKIEVYFTIQPRDIANLTDTSIEADDILVEANGKV